MIEERVVDRQALYQVLRTIMWLAVSTSALLLIYGVYLFVSWWFHDGADVVSNEIRGILPSLLATWVFVLVALGMSVIGALSLWCKGTPIQSRRGKRD